MAKHNSATERIWSRNSWFVRNLADFTKHKKPTQAKAAFRQCGFSLVSISVTALLRQLFST